MPRPMLRGAFTALVTPFTADGALDREAFRRLVRWQVMAGIDGLVPCGTTGEAPTLTPGRARVAHRHDRRGRLGAAVARPRPGHRRDRHQRHGGHHRGDAPGRRAGRGCRARRRALLQPAERPDARGPLPGRGRRGRPAHRRLQRPVADRHERRRRHVPAAGRASAGHRGQGGQRQPRADRHDLSRAAAGRGGPGRRRCLDAAAAGPRWRRRRVRGQQRDPGRARGPVRGRSGRRLGGGPPDPRALAAAVPGQLRGRSQPGPGQGRPGDDGPARARRGPRAPAHPGSRMPRRPWRSPSGRSAWSSAAVAGWWRPRRTGRPWHDDVVHPTAADAETAGTPTAILDALEAGTRRAAWPDPTAAGGWRVDARGQGRHPRRLPRPHDDGLGGRSPHLPRPGGLPAAGPARRPVADRARGHGRATRRAPGPRRRGHAAVVHQRRGVDRRLDDGRFPRPRGELRPDRGAGPSRRRRDHRWRARAARGAGRSSSRTTRSSAPAAPCWRAC